MILVSTPEPLALKAAFDPVQLAIPFFVLAIILEILLGRFGKLVGSILFLSLLLIVIVAAYVAIPFIVGIATFDFLRRLKWRLQNREKQS